MSKIDYIVEQYHCGDTYGEFCDLDCEYCKKCIREDLEEIRTDAIDEYTEVLRPIVSELRSALMENKNAFIDLDIIAQRLKEQKNE